MSTAYFHNEYTRDISDLYKIITLCQIARCVGRESIKSIKYGERVDSILAVVLVTNKMQQTLNKLLFDANIFCRFVFLGWNRIQILLHI